jgi:signal transduction histidine kinase
MTAPAHTSPGAISFHPEPGQHSTYLAAFFVLVWPSFNLLFLTFVLIELGIFELTILGTAAAKMYALFTLSYVIITGLLWAFPVGLAEERFWRQLLLHCLIILFVGQFLGPLIPPSAMQDLPETRVFPVTFTLFQVALFVSVKSFLLQRERNFQAQLNLRQAEINVLRSQSNPHFLFNTLNLLASEIGRNPNAARETVYDLADLLRDSMKAAEKQNVSVREELALVALYLRLQQKRFPDRLTYAIDCDEDCGDSEIPALLLQPIVENAVKHVVAPNTGETHIDVAVAMQSDKISIEVRDTGPMIDLRAIAEGGGLRIVRKTLALQYPNQHDISFSSTQEGGIVTLRIPRKILRDPA